MKQAKFNKLSEDMEKKLDWLDEELSKKKIPHRKDISKDEFIRYQILIYSEESKEDYCLSDCIWTASSNLEATSYGAYEEKFEYYDRKDEPVPLTAQECLDRFISDYKKVRN